MEGKQKMKNVLTIKNYKSWQDKFEKKFEIRLLRDNEYDKRRMKKSFKK